MDAEEPALALCPVEQRVPFDRLARSRHGAHDERVEAALDSLHERDWGLQVLVPRWKSQVKEPVIRWMSDQLFGAKFPNPSGASY
jgi:hypothetical protein